MKKAICLALVVLMLMNAMGYYFVFLGFQVRSDRRLTDQLENDSYDQTKAITIKVPISIPYMMDQPDFSRADGKFLNEGKYYRMVKQRYANDTLTVVCVRDTNQEQIQTALSDYVKTFTDNSQQPTKHNSKYAFSPIKDFISSEPESVAAIEGWTREIKIENAYFVRWDSSNSKAVIQPPENGPSFLS